MSDLRQAAQEAWEALLAIRFRLRPEHQETFALIRDQLNDRATDAITALEQALAEPEPIEDVVVYGSAWSKDGKRIDPMSVYKEPEQEPNLPDPESAFEKWRSCQPYGGATERQKSAFIDGFRAAALALHAEPEQERDPVVRNGWVVREVWFDNGEPTMHRDPEQEPVAQYSDIVSDGGLDPRNKFDSAPTPRKPLTVPEGYALISIDALKAWGKYDEVLAACQYGITGEQT